MRYRLLASYQGAPYEVGIGPADNDVVLFAACPPPEELGFEPATGHWRKQVRMAEVQTLHESRPVGLFRNEPCVVLDDLGDRLHIAYLGHDSVLAEKLGYWEVDRGVYELIAPRQDITDIVEQQLPFPGGAGAGPVGPSLNPAPVGQALPTQAGPVPLSQPIPGQPIPGQLPPTELPSALVPPGLAPSAQLPPAQLPPAQLPPAQLPPAQLPPAQLPLAQLPLAQLPSTQLPPAQLPLAQLPLAQLPLAQLPSTQLPEPQAPAAQAPPPQAPPAQLTPQQLPAQIPPSHLPPAQMPPPQMPPAQMPPPQMAPPLPQMAPGLAAQAPPPGQSPVGGYGQHEANGVNGTRSGPAGRETGQNGHARSRRPVSDETLSDVLAPLPPDLGPGPQPTFIANPPDPGPQPTFIANPPAGSIAVPVIEEPPLPLEAEALRAATATRREQSDPMSDPHLGTAPEPTAGTIAPDFASPDFASPDFASPDFASPAVGPPDPRLAPAPGLAAMPGPAAAPEVAPPPGVSPGPGMTTGTAPRPKLVAAGAASRSGVAAEAAAPPAPNTTALAGADVPQAAPRRRRAARKRLPTQRIFSDLAAQAAIPPAAYAIGEEVDGAMCLLRTAEGFEVFNAAAGARHEARVFQDEESAYFYLFGVLVADAVRTGALAPR